MPSKKMKVTETPKAARHIDRLRTNTLQDFDWANQTGTSFRKRAADNNFALDEHGLEVLKGKGRK
jgi:hypothetical protein